MGRLKDDFTETPDVRAQARYGKRMEVRLSNEQIINTVTDQSGIVWDKSGIQLNRLRIPYRHVATNRIETTATLNIARRPNG